MPLPNPLKALLIDLDGTLADSSPFLYKAYASVLKKRGLNPTKEEYSSLCGPTIYEAASILQKKYGLKEDHNAIYKEWKSILLPYYREEIVSAQGAEEIFAMAAERWKLALVTSAEEVFVNAFLEKNPFKFDLVICKEHYKASKPDPEPYLLALKKLECPANSSIAIEDTENGALSATRAGVYTFLITEEEVPIAHVVKKFKDVADILKRTYG